MNAFVSGQAKTALLIEDDAFHSFDLDTPEILKPRLKSDFRYLFGEAVDLRFINDTDQETAFKELQSDSDKASALNLMLMLLDSDISDAKTFIADALEDLLAEEVIAVYLESVLYAKPLPEGADTEQALRLCNGTFTKVHAWLSDLVDRQYDIAFVRESWDGIPAAAFADEETKGDFQRAFVHEHVFRDLVLACHNSAKIGSLSLRVRMLKSITGLPNFRSVLQDLFRPFSEPRVSNEEKRLQKDEREALDDPKQKGNLSFDREAVRESVQRQIEYITEFLKKRDLASAQRMVNQLMDYQKGKGEPIHRVKSLCQVAFNAKEFGLYEFQLELTERARQLVYSDSWAQRQYADALLQNNRFEEALVAYDIAMSFLDRSDIEDYVVLKNGYAEVLKAQGKFDEALKIYEQTMEDHPGYVRTKSGYAEVLKAQGKLREASEIYEEIRRDYPESVVAQNGHAEVLKAQGKLREALEIYEETCRNYPENVVAKTGYAGVLKAQGKLREALEIYEEIRRDHPEDVVAKTGYAEVLKAQGRLDKALEIYEETRRDHPEEVVAKNGLCGTLFALGRYKEALENLPNDNLISLSDWIGFHIRGMIMLKTGNIVEAVRIFEKGMNENPIPASKEYFRSALAIARLKRGEFKEASELLIEKTVSPLLQPAIDILRAHALGERHLYQDAEIAYLEFENAAIKNNIVGYQNTQVLELAMEVKNRYVTDRVRSKPDNWLFEHEENMLMALAP